MKKYCRFWIPVYDDDAVTPPNTPPPAPPGSPPMEKDQKFTQDQVNSLMAKEKREGAERMRKLGEELEALKARSNLTQKEREELETRVQNVRDELLTKEELSKQEKDKLIKDHDKELKKLEDEKTTWQTRFTEAIINQSIVEASVLHKAFSPEQIVALLRPSTRLVEEMDSEGKKTGKMIPKVQFRDIDKENKPVTLDLTVLEAVKRMSEKTQYQNLFNDGTSGGLGGTNRGIPAGPPDLIELAKDPEKWREYRAKHGIT